MVGGEVEPRRHLGREPLGEPQPERRRLDDEHVDGFVEGGNEGHVGVSDRERLATRRVEHVGDHRRHRGLAVGAGDRDDRPVSVVPIGREIELAHDRKSATGRLDDRGMVLGNAGARHEHVDRIEQRRELAVSRTQVHAVGTTFVVGALDVDAARLANATATASPVIPIPYTSSARISPRPRCG